jgi:hypothetical protein
MKCHFKNKKSLLGFMAVVMMLIALSPPSVHAQKLNFHENPTAKRIYDRLKSSFHKPFFESVDSYSSNYSMTYSFVQPSEYRKYVGMIEEIRLALDSIKCVRKVTNMEDSCGVTKIKYVMVMYDSLTKQRDYIWFKMDGLKIDYDYAANMDARETALKADNSISNRHILDCFDSLFVSYSKRKGVKKEAVAYQGKYMSNIFQISDEALNNRTGGYKYIVPNCSEGDFRKFVNLFRQYMKKNQLVFVNTCNDTNSDDQTEVYVIRHDGRAVAIGAILVGGDLHLIYVTNIEKEKANKRYLVLPFGWNEDVAPWEDSVLETPKASEAYVKDGENVYLSVDQESSFPGGIDAMKKFIDEHKNTSIPSNTQVSGYNLVQFIIGSDGVVHDVHIVKSLDAETDAESIRVVSMMPKWEPAVKKHKKVSSSKIIPITYNINN